MSELPRPEDFWLELDGERYTSELPLAAVDLTRRGHTKIQVKRSESGAQSI